ncbi:hypothetical protein GCM10010420_45590 [Streptomyces glaucosporus]|uniref:Uncharacterized protein n=1 Tax=Streptomyces glaucosporus TaxID=284044 RepID=A0ABN3IR91_9ACTN
MRSVYEYRWRSGGAWGMVGWLRGNTGVPGVDHTVRFDAEENRYVFTWGESGRPA